MNILRDTANIMESGFLRYIESIVLTASIA